MSTTVKLGHRKEGDAISVTEWNALVDFVNRPFHASDYHSSPAGTVIHNGIGGEAVPTTRRFCRITEVVGAVPPFQYSAVEVEEIEGGDFQDLSGGEVITRALYNNPERDSDNGQGRLPIDHIVEFWASAVEGEFRCDALWYRASYG